MRERLRSDEPVSGDSVRSVMKKPGYAVTGGAGAHCIMLRETVPLDKMA